MNHMQNMRYYIIFKPFGMLSQFSPEGGKAGLGDLFSFPKDVYPVGRLDSDSEGLLILTNDKKLNHQLLNPNFRHQRTYWVQVEGMVTEEAKQQLEKGVSISINKKKYKTLPLKANIIPEPNPLPNRTPPIRFRKNVPTSWLELHLIEGKNRQVRRMTAAVGFPTLRLIRARIEDIFIGDMQPGDVKELSREQILRSLKIKN